MFEVKILEILNPSQTTRDGQSGRTRPVLKVGLATQGSCLFLGDTEDSVCFDSDGQYTSAKSSAMAVPRFAREQVYSVVVNLDDGSPNAHTISLFRDGVRMCQPQKLPEALKGKPLFPAVTYRNLTVQVNFGAESMTKLPFSCRMVQDASVVDAKVLAAPKPKDGKYEVVFPCFLPDEGTFDWLDMWLEKNPDYTELSERMILSWAQKSGLFRQKGYDWKSSNDKPGMQFGVQALDDLTVCEILKTVAPVLERNLIVMEVKANLIKDDREALAKRFALDHCKKVAMVVMGEPDAAFKTKTHELLLKEKQEKADQEFKIHQLEEAQKRQLEKRKREIEKEHKKAERAVKRAKKAQDDEAKKAAEAAAAEAAAAAATEEKKEGEEAKEEEKKEEEKKPEEDKEEGEEEEKEDEEPEEKEPPKVSLTHEEKKVLFRKQIVTDLSAWELSTCFTNFSIPAKEEGFEEIRYEWSKKTKCAEYIKDWLLNKKLTTRIEDLKTSDGFQQQYGQFQAQVNRWRSKQNEWKETVRMRALAKERKAAAEVAAKAFKEAQQARVAAEKKAKQEAKEAAEKLAKEAKEEAERKAKEEAEKKEAEGREEKKEKEEGAEGEKADEPMEKKEEVAAAEPEKKEEEKKEEDDEEPAKEEEEAKAPDEDDTPIDLDGDDDFDVFGVENIMDIGKGQPLFANFSFEDWALMGLRYEFHKLAHAFRQDVADPERLGIHVDHLIFYYNKYFRKSLIQKHYGVETFEELVGLVSDSARINPANKVLESHLSDELDSFDLFVKLTEECRRERSLKADFGDEAAQLKFAQALMAPASSSGYSGGAKGSYGRDYQRSPRTTGPYAPAPGPQAPLPQQSQKGYSNYSSSKGQPKGGATVPAPYPSHHSSGGYQGGKSAPVGGSSFGGSKSGGYQGSKGGQQKGSSYSAPLPPPAGQPQSSYGKGRPSYGSSYGSSGGKGGSYGK